MDTPTPSPAHSPVPPRTRAAAEVANRYLRFLLRGKLYALDLRDVTEVLEYQTLTVVPMTPPFIRGVLNLRGRVVPVIDLVARFGDGSTEIGHRSGIVIVHVTGADGVSRQVGVIVDGIEKVVHIDADDVEPSPVFGGGIRADFITGMARQEGAFVIVLDIGRVLTSADLGPLDRAVALGPEVGPEAGADAT
jgi:purine-binding chemotaxis protein CheW